MANNTRIIQDGFFVTAKGVSAASEFTNVVAATPASYSRIVSRKRFDADDRRCDFYVIDEADKISGGYPASVTDADKVLSYTIDDNNNKHWSYHGWYDGSGALAAAQADKPAGGTAATLFIEAIEESQLTDGRVTFNYEWKDQAQTGSGFNYIFWTSQVFKKKIENYKTFAAGGGATPIHILTPNAGSVVIESGSAIMHDAYPTAPDDLYTTTATMIEYDDSSMDISLHEKGINWQKIYYFNTSDVGTITPPTRT